MADISLREYVQKVENLIENNEIDQAIAHCKHILHVYPKHIDSYRLLGKAFLEKQKYSDASDIFQRVLSSIPDDFISHIGMSIIREDENNLDASIWHMERAFEVQPSNKAVQDELRRLYTNRDGVAPPKIRLTRGALVRMYVRGELYEQAIGEINSALEEDPNRIDLEVILAKIYFNTDKKVEATETCSKIITKLPYSFEANKILTEILPGTTREEDQKVFRQRVIDLDPYFEFTNDTLRDSQEISDSKIMVEYLDWDPLSDMYDQPDWAKSIGLSVDEDNSLENDISFWLSDSEKEDSEISADETIPEEKPEEIAIEEGKDTVGMQEILSEYSGNQLEETEINEEQTALTDETSQNGINIETPGEDLPEWLKEAGWEKSTEDDTEIQKGFSLPPFSAELTDELSETEDIDSVEPGEIPDWIKDIAPSEELLEENKLFQEDEFEIKNFEDLITGIESEDSTTSPVEKVSNWESEFDNNSSPLSDLTENEDEAEIEFSDIFSDSNSGEGEENENTQEDEVDDLDWLKGISLDEDQVDELQMSKSQEFNLDFDDSFEKETKPEDIPSQFEEGKENWINADLSEEPGNELESIKSLEFKTEDTEEIDEELPDWIKSVVENDEIEEIEDVEFVSPENLVEFSPISEEDQDEIKDEFTISFDENDEFPDLEEFDLEKSGFDANSDTEELEDELEEKFADQTLSQLERDMISEIEDLPSLQENQEISDLIMEPEDSISSSESDKKDIESTIAWMEGLVAAQNVPIASDDLDEKESDKSKESVEEKPEWISEILDSSESDFSDMDTTPSWLRELEIEAENVGNEPQIPEDLLEESTISDAETEDIEELEIQIEEIGGEKESSFVEETANLEIESNTEEPSLEFDSKLVDGDQIADDEIEPIAEEIEIVADEDAAKFEEEVDLIPELIGEQSQDFIIDLPDLEAENIEVSLRTQTEEIEEQVEDMLREESELDQEQEPSLAGSEMSLETEFEPEELPDETAFAETERVSVEEISEEPFEEFVETQPAFVEEISKEPIAEFVKTHTPSVEGFRDQPTEELVEIIPGLEETPIGIDDLEEAKKLLTSGAVDQSIIVFNDLIKDNIFLEDIISNIQNALDHHYPINIDLWKTLGDAFLKNKQFQKALDAYSKAEDLLL